MAEDWDNRGIGIDFLIPKTGKVFQLSPDLRKYYTSHASRNTAFRGRKNQAVGARSIGIEIGQKANISNLDPKYPEVQVSAVAALCADLCAEFGWDKDDITTHRLVITDGSRSDPREFPWEAFWEEFNEILYKGADPAITPVTAPTSEYHTVVAGDTLWALSIKYRTTIERIKALNNMNTLATVIKEGQKLQVR